MIKEFLFFVVEKFQNSRNSCWFVDKKNRNIEHSFDILRRFGVFEANGVVQIPEVFEKSVSEKKEIEKKFDEFLDTHRIKIMKEFPQVYDQIIIQLITNGSEKVRNMERVEYDYLSSRGINRINLPEEDKKILNIDGKIKNLFYQKMRSVGSLFTLISLFLILFLAMTSENQLKIFWISIILFSLLGGLRGWTSEMLLMSFQIFGLGAVFLISFFWPDFGITFSIPYIDTVIIIMTLLLFSIIGLLSVKLIRNFFLMNYRSVFENLLLGLFLGAVNGYFYIGNIGYYLSKQVFFNEIFSRSPQIIELINLSPPIWMQPPVIFISIGISIVFLLVNFI